MSYDIYITNNDIRITKDNLPQTLKALRDTDREHCADHPDLIDPDATITDILENLGFTVQWEGTPDDSDLISLYTDEPTRSYDEETYLAAIAPYIENGSHLDFEGEDGYRWRYAFRDGEMTQYDGFTVYEDDVEKLERLLAEAKAIRAKAN